MKLIYYEAYTEREDAEGREQFLKSGAGRRFLRAQLRHYFKRFPTWLGPREAKPFTRLALIGDAADGYPGIPGIGARTAAQLLNRYGKIENFPSNVLGKQRDLALLFKKLATLRTDAPLFKKVETLRWRGATPAFAAWAKRMEAPRLLERCDRVKLRHAVLREWRVTIAPGPNFKMLTSPAT
jgi:hypothetical protein